MNEKDIKRISNSLKFEASKDVADKLMVDFKDINDKINVMKAIDTDGVIPMERIDDKPITFLREDIVGKSLDKKIILNNAPNADADFVVINKEVSNEK